MNKFIVSLVAVSLTGLSFSSLAVTQVLTLNEQVRLNAHIALDAMNRITVTNDRIVNLFGDEGTFVTQNDENSGQIFIKPTPENQQKSLSLTLVTENGLTQDLSLIPDAETPTTLILKVGRQAVHPSFEGARSPLKSPSTVDTAVHVLKQAMLGQLPVYKESLKPRKVASFKLTHQNTFMADGFRVQHWVIQNTTKQSQELLEKNLYETGVRALSVEKHWLEKGEKVEAYILKADVPHA